MNLKSVYSLINTQFDISNIFMRSLFAINGFGKMSYSFDNQKELDELMRKVAMDVSFIIRGINPGRVIFSVDDKSWRKSIFIEENDGYKGSRKKLEGINWDNVYAIMDEFLSIARDYGFIVSKIDKAEADDIMTLWASAFIDRNEHIISISGDEDIRQLVYSNAFDSVDTYSKPAYSVVFNPFLQGKNASRKLYIPKGFDSWLNKDAGEVSIWNMSESINPDKEDFKRLHNMDKTKFEETDGKMIRLRKIFCGDDGDDIPSIFTWLTDKTDPKTGELKTARFTESKFVKLYEDLKISPNEEFDYDVLLNRKEKVLDLIIKHTNKTPVFSIGERILRQIKLVALDPTVFPKSIREQFDLELNDNLNLPRPDIASITMHTLLQGTRYVKAGYEPKKRGAEISIFKEIDRININKKLF